MRGFIIGVSRVDTEPNPPRFMNGAHGYTVWMVTDDTGNRQVSGHMCEQLFVPDRLLEAARLPKPIPGVSLIYEWGKRGRLAAVNGYEYEPGYTYEGTCKASVMITVIDDSQ